ncbi:MAG TPA: alpha/beta fold hydrolase [Polyangiaceae bacterium]|nr:alpha/beta fold hydrolase [Polyangiaceae bacterium]
MLCCPLGFELLSSYRTYQRLADALSLEGFPVLRFDYPGTGNSLPAAQTTDEVSEWLAGVRDAIEEVRELSGAERVSLAGLRFGATLAALASEQLAWVESLVLWAPCVSGRGYARELQAASRLKPSEVPLTDGIEAYGFAYSKRALDAISAVDLRKLDVSGKHVLLLERDDVASTSDLAKSWTSSASSLEARSGLGYAAMMVEPHNSVLPRETIANVVDWLAKRHPERELSAESAEPQVTTESGYADRDYFETPLTFGQRSHLFGILTQPAAQRGDHERMKRPVLLLLSAGADHSIGPHRMHVDVARAAVEAGYTCFRLDASGIGDSRIVDQRRRHIYEMAAVEDVRAAMDAITERTGAEEFILLGLCSGAFVAFQTTQVDSRVVGEILINPRRLTLGADASMHDEFKLYHKSSSYYVNALLSREHWARFLRGKLSIRGGVRYLTTLAAVRAQKFLNAKLRGLPEQDEVCAGFQQICQRGTRTLVLAGLQDNGVDYLEYHIGHRGSKLARFEGFRVQLLAGSDHAFSTVHSQRMLRECILEELRAHRFRDMNVRSGARERKSAVRLKTTERLPDAAASRGSASGGSASRGSAREFQ